MSEERFWQNFTLILKAFSYEQTSSTLPDYAFFAIPQELLNFKLKEQVGSNLDWEQLLCGDCHWREQ